MNRLVRYWLRVVVLGLLLGAALAFPDHTLPVLRDSATAARGASVISAAAIRRDSLGVASIIAANTRLRVLLRPTDIAADILFTEAAALRAVGDDAGAAAHADQVLADLNHVATEALTQITTTSTLVRMAALRAELAFAAGDRALARTWASAVVHLWNRSDPFLQPRLRALEALTR